MPELDRAKNVPLECLPLLSSCGAKAPSSSKEHQGNGFQAQTPTVWIRVQHEDEYIDIAVYR
jgi:hypothetical protein